MALAAASCPNSPTASFPALSPRPPSLTLSRTFKAFDGTLPHLASPCPSTFARSASFKHLDVPLDRFDIAALRKSFSRTQVSPSNPSRWRNVNASHSGCATEQREAGQKEDFYGQNGIGSVRKNCYSILNVPQSASPKEIRLAYRELALQYHPDVSPLHQLESATKLFSQINEAYAILSDPQRRKCYDLHLAINAPTTAGGGYVTARKYINMANGRVYPSMNAFYREWKGTRNWETDQCWC